jgi:hypothetical protein
MEPDARQSAMILQDDKWLKTCKDFDYIDVPCCDICHDEELAESALRVVQIDNEPALLCCAKISFFYPEDPNIGLSPEEKLLRAIFGEKAQHDQPQEGD